MKAGLTVAAAVAAVIAVMLAGPAHADPAPDKGGLLAPLTLPDIGDAVSKVPANMLGATPVPPGSLVDLAKAIPGMGAGMPNPADMGKLLPGLPGVTGKPGY
ncbi:hypothetical protein [Herbidospora yilanensis]|uniref:hypothetical protein n=1 Tax=Herbidospora yilanensis TaxID=354426 RepID=UPI0012F74207|nr:hypothetical protein [Herbidospora yilanensis]